jgi:hypothetical protein
VANKPVPGGILRVFLHGTGGRPSGSSYLLNAIAGCKKAAIGLSYGAFAEPDAKRNKLCAEKHNSSRANLHCLGNMHKDALWGGDREKDLWGEVRWEDSVSGRLVFLMKYLNKTFPDEGWGQYLDEKKDRHDRQQPKWKLLFVGGHSQGAGHAGYLAVTIRLAGAALLSGPQDECLNCNSSSILGTAMWTQKDWKTKQVNAAMHAKEDAAEAIKGNWRRMADQLNWPDEPVDIGSGQQQQLPHGALVSDLSPSNAHLPRCYHMSMAIDAATPIAKIAASHTAVYAIGLWPNLFAEPIRSKNIPGTDWNLDESLWIIFAVLSVIFFFILVRVSRRCRRSRTRADSILGNWVEMDGAGKRPESFTLTFSKEDQDSPRPQSP